MQITWTLGVWAQPAWVSCHPPASQLGHRDTGFLREFSLGRGASADGSAASATPAISQCPVTSLSFVLCCDPTPAKSRSSWGQFHSRAFVLAGTEEPLPTQPGQGRARQALTRSPPALPGADGGILLLLPVPEPHPGAQTASAHHPCSLSAHAQLLQVLFALPAQLLFRENSPQKLSVVAIDSQPQPGFVEVTK